ncbi:MAG: N-formylglutamate amidohydrolase [Polyangiaceae bacterium]|nr:N-formylglutamate amidohydrolase [Polyangiaceae bacterium]
MTSGGSDHAFSLLAPVGEETPLLVEIPHAGLQLDAPSLARLTAPAQAIARDADLYVDELYADAPIEGATVLVAHISRYVCDLNRAESDVDLRAVAGARGRTSPHGLVWWSTTDGGPALERPLDPSELERRLDLYYRPYHRILTEVLEQKRRKFGHVMLLCAHSMPSVPRGVGAENPAGSGVSPNARRADIVPGSQGGTTASRAVVACPEILARERGWSVAHDLPYRGGFSTVRHGHPETGSHALQVEISRNLYMDEASLEKKAIGFEQVRAFCRSLVARLSVLDLA